MKVLNKNGGTKRNETLKTPEKERNLMGLKRNEEECLETQLYNFRNFILTFLILLYINHPAQNLDTENHKYFICLLEIFSAQKSSQPLEQPQKTHILLMDRTEKT